MSDTGYNLPDALGAVTGGARQTIGPVQCALGIYPLRSAPGQPFEVLILLQSMVDEEIGVSLQLALPRKSPKGGRAGFIPAGGGRFAFKMGPGEVGLVHWPVRSDSGTAPSDGYSLVLRVTPSKARGTTYLRSPKDDNPALFLTLSPIHLNVLRDVGFSAEAYKRQDQLIANFGIMVSPVPTDMPIPDPHYEVLWTLEDLQAERAREAELMGKASRFADALTRHVLFEPLYHALIGHLIGAGFEPYDMEAFFIAKLLTYTVESGMEQEMGGRHRARWFRQLCLLMNQDEAVTEDVGALFGEKLFVEVTHDGVRLAARVLRGLRDLSVDNYSPDKASRLADAFAEAMRGRRKLSMPNVYSPLLLAGVAVTHRFKLSGEDPRHNIDRLKSVWRKRMLDLKGRHSSVFRSLNAVIRRAEELLSLQDRRPEV